MAVKKTTAKCSPTKKKAAAKKPAAKKKVVKKAAPKKATAKKATAKKAAKPSAKKAVKKPATKKKAVAKKPSSAKATAGKKAAPKKAAAKKKATPKKAAAKKVAPKKPAAKKAVAEMPAPKPSSAKAAEGKKAAPRKAAKRSAAKKKEQINDPLAPRPKKRPKKIDVLRPGRKKANNHTVKPKSYRAMTAKQKEKYRLQLLEIRERISGQVASLKNDSLTRADEVNIEEDGTDAFDRQFALNLASSENEVLIAIDGALKRIEEGSFGKCHECGGGIESRRLKAIPFVENCISCQSEVEKHRPGYRPPMRLD
jgi:RNA polymerase-binding protein DksA